MDRLNELRKKIDVLDAELLQVIGARLKVVAEVGKIKKELGIPPLDSVRWNQVLEKAMTQASALGLRREFIKKILDTIHDEALLIEQ